MITTVVFDLDDTLYDEIEYCKSGFAAVSEFLAASSGSHSAECIFDVLWNHFTAGNRTKTFNAALDELGTHYDDERIQELVQIYRFHVPKITLPADSRNTLSKLRSEYTLALLTDGFLPAQQLKVQALGIEEYFETIVYTEQLGRECWKPSPAAAKPSSTSAWNMGFGSGKASGTPLAAPARPPGGHRSNRHPAGPGRSVQNWAVARSRCCRLRQHS